MGGLTIGTAYKDAGAGTANNVLVVAAKYAFESGAVKGTIHYGSNNIGGTTAGAASLNSSSMALVFQQVHSELLLLKQKAM